MLYGVLGHTTNTVSAHLRPRTVRVEHDHADIGTGRRSDQNQTVASNALVPVGDNDGKCGRLVDVLVMHIHEHVVVSQTVHLGEVHMGNDSVSGLGGKRNGKCYRRNVPLRRP